MKPIDFIVRIPAMITTLLFILKACGVFTGSWWWVFSPILIVIGFYATITLICFLIWYFLLK